MRKAAVTSASFVMLSVVLPIRSIWSPILNKCKAVIVPTEWCKEVFKSHGTVVPIYVCSLGVNTRIYRPAKTEIYKILTVHEGFGSISSREDWQTTLKALEYFGGEIKLTIKTWNNKVWKLPEYAEIFTFEICQSDMAALYHSHNAFIKNSPKS